MQLKLPAIIGAILLISACQPQSSTGPGGMASDSDACGASAYAGLVGQPVSAFNRPTGRTVRIIRPGEPVTLDFNPSRLNVLVGSNGRIESFECY